MTYQKKENNVAPSFISEAVCAALLQTVSFENIKTHFIGNFKKSYSNDIEKFEWEDYNGGYNFDIYINRNGIYDLLPEGLFHQTLGNARVQNVPDAVKEHKRYREEERAARSFFAPIEQMLFRYRVYAEAAETEALFDIQNGKLNSSFYHFWDIDQNLPEQQSKRMLQLMPYSYFIKGDVNATASALSFILGKPVAINQPLQPGADSLALPKSMIDCRLGIDTVLGEQTKELLPYWIFTISDIGKKELAEYIQGAAKGKLLQRFGEIFIPLEIDYRYEMNTLANSTGEESEEILGYASYI